METKTKIVAGSIVKVTNEEYCGYDCKGLVIATDSKSNPDCGPIAVFFDREVKSSALGIFCSDEKFEIPNQDNYADNQRVFHYTEDDLEVCDDFDLEDLAVRAFPENIAIYAI